MTDFGRVGHIRTDTYGMDTDCTFMVVGEHADDRVRNGKPTLRQVIVLSGTGYIGTKAILPGDIGAVALDDDAVTWFDD